MFLVTISTDLIIDLDFFSINYISLLFKSEKQHVNEKLKLFMEIASAECANNLPEDLNSILTAIEIDFDVDVKEN